MPQLSTTATENYSGQTAGAPALPWGLGDGAVLYPSRQQAVAAGLQKTSGQPIATVKKLSQVRYGEQYLAQDGQALPCTLESLLQFQASGFAVVMAVMAGLYLVCSALSRVIRSWEPSRDKLSDPVAPWGLSPSGQAAAATGIHPGLSDQQLVVILTAAACEAMNGPVRIDRIRQVHPGDSNWSAQGRSVLHSHRLK